MKALNNDCEIFEEFPPGHYWSSKSGKLEYGTNQVGLMNIFPMEN
jgi:hypothetical protein